MAKQMMHPGMCAPVWLGLLVFLVGVWFILVDLGVLTTKVSIWPIIITLIGLKMLSKSCRHK
jgi:uncharacterized membrane protein